MTLPRKSIKFRLIVLSAAIAVVHITIFNILIWENQTELIMNNNILKSIQIGTQLKASIDKLSDTNTFLTPDMASTVIGLCADIDVKNFAIYNQNGTCFLAVHNGFIDSSSHVSNAEDVKHLHTALTVYTFEDKPFYYRMFQKNKAIDVFITLNILTVPSILKMSIELDDIQRQMKYLLRQCLVMTLVIILLYLIVIVAIMRIVIKPLTLFSKAAKSIAQGNYSISIPIARPDEIGRLASLFNEMSIAIQRMHDEAKQANPLTGLPGNNVIRHYVEWSIKHGKIICILYCDLDNFKAYNDKYGFSKGDEVILYTKECLVSASQKFPKDHVFIGHTGGDDFVVITPYEFWEQYAQMFIATFDRNIHQFYSEADARSGYITSFNRQGETQRFALISVSVAVVSNFRRVFVQYAEIIQVAAEVKKFVKSKEGSCYAIDRRTTGTQTHLQRRS